MTDLKIAIITGASEGMGKAIFLNLIRDNFRVVLVSRSQEKLDKALAEAGEQAKNTRVYSADVTESVQVEVRVRSHETATALWKRNGWPIL